jgi:hypothetical protein
MQAARLRSPEDQGCVAPNMRLARRGSCRTGFGWRDNDRTDAGVHDHDVRRWHDPLHRPARAALRRRQRGGRVAGAWWSGIRRQRRNVDRRRGIAGPRTVSSPRAERRLSATATTARRLWPDSRRNRVLRMPWIPGWRWSPSRPTTTRGWTPAPNLPRRRWLTITGINRPATAARRHRPATDM